MRPVPDIDPCEVIIDTAKYLPSMSEIPEEFRSEDKWLCAQSDLCKGHLTPKEGVNADQAFRVISAIQSSFDPTYRHKRAGVAFLLSEWFEDYRDDTRLPDLE